MKIFTVIGARPQFIKALPVSKIIKKSRAEEFIVHTGQHYDEKLSKIFFDELGDIEPNINLDIRSGTHAEQTAKMMIKLEDLMLEQKPNCVLVYGDTNSTLAGALVAIKINIPVVHVEAGLRSFNKIMPEEHNRVLTDHCSSLLICPTENAKSNLFNEGITSGVYVLGDTMYDSVLQFSNHALKHSNILDKLEVSSKRFLLATIHRSQNTDCSKRLLNIFEALSEINETVILPLHPRTKSKLIEFGYEKFLKHNSTLKIIDPIGYIDMLSLEKHAKTILTDSGGMQKEAYFLSTPCLTLRDETEWIETVKAGWNKVVGTNKISILSSLSNFKPLKDNRSNLFGDGHTSEKIVKTILDSF